MGFLSNLFGGSDIVKKAGDLIDDAFYTDAEKAEDKKEMDKFKANQKIKMLEAYHPYKVTQRFIAFGFVGVFLFIMLCGVLGSLFGVVDMENVKEAMKFANELWLGQIVMVIISFYFGGGLVESIGRRDKGKQ